MQCPSCKPCIACGRKPNMWYSSKRKVWTCAKCHGRFDPKPYPRKLK